MIKLLSILILTMPLWVSAQAPQVISLYDQKSRLPEALIPFKLAGSGSILSVAMVSPEPGICHVMRDPFLANIFLLKCRVETNATVLIKATNGGSQIFEISYGPIEIKKPFANVVVIAPDVPITNPDALRGQDLFGSYCLDCHKPYQKPDRTTNQIKSAIQSIGQMRNNPIYKLETLTADDLKKIEAYLKGF